MVNSVRDTLNQWVAPLAVIACGLLLLSRWVSSGMSLPTGNATDQISHNGVRGSAIVVNQIPYTLNFAQQNNVIDALDHAVAVSKDTVSAESERPFFQKLIFYRFNQPDLVVQPIEQRRTALLLDIPEWSTTHYYLDASSEELTTTLKGAFGP